MSNSEYLDNVKKYTPTGCLPTGDRKYHIKEMNDLHKEITRLIFLGMKNVDIAETLNITPATVCNVRNSAIVQKELRLMQGAANKGAVDVVTRLKELCTPALEVLADTLEKENFGDARLKATTAFGVLDRCGHSPIRKVVAATGKLTPEDIEDIKKRAVKFGPIVDVTDGEYEQESEEELAKDLSEDI